MGKLVFLLLVAFVCSAFGVDETLKFKPDLGDFEDDPSKEDDLNYDEEPTQDVDGEDKRIDKAALEKAAEDKTENADSSALASLISAQKMRFADQNDDNDETDLAKMEGTGKSVGWWWAHHTHVHHHYHYHYHHHHLPNQNVYSLKCQSGTIVEGKSNNKEPYIYRTIRFRTNFKRAPAVVIRIQTLESSRNVNERFRTQIIHRTRTYMRVKISTSGNHDSLRYLSVNWTACPR